jgi:putative peptidoglycan lipid II flippase
MTLLDAAGLALATALASMLNGIILIAVLDRRLGRIDWGSLVRSGCRVLSACIPVLGICVWVAGASMWMEGGNWIVKAAALFGGIGLSIMAYLGVHIMLGSEELDVVLGMVKRKLGRVTRKFGAA